MAQYTKMQEAMGVKNPTRLGFGRKFVGCLRLDMMPDISMVDNHVDNSTAHNYNKIDNT